MDSWIGPYGSSEFSLLHNGPQFLKHFSSFECFYLSTKLLTATAYHRQTNCQWKYIRIQSQLDFDTTSMSISTTVMHLINRWRTPTTTRYILLDWYSSVHTNLTDGASVTGWHNSPVRNFQIIQKWRYRHDHCSRGFCNPLNWWFHEYKEAIDCQDGQGAVRLFWLIHSILTAVQITRELLFWYNAGHTSKPHEVAH